MGGLRPRGTHEAASVAHSQRIDNRAVDLEGRLRHRLEVVEQLLPLAEEKGVPLAQLATAWVLANPDVTAAILGPRTEEQLDDSLRALEVEVTPEEARRIDELVPPGTSAL